MDIKDITPDDWREAEKAVRQRRNELAGTEEEMEHKIREAKQDLEEVGRLVLDASDRLQLLEQAMVLRDEPLVGENIPLRMHLSIYCEMVARDDIGPEETEKLMILMEQCQSRLRKDCEHTVVVYHDNYVYGTEKWETAGHMVCAYCGLSEIEGSEGFIELSSAPGRTFVYYCGPDEEPDYFPDDPTE